MSVSIPVEKIPCFVCSDPRVNNRGWEFSKIGGTHRDADALAQSNHRVLLRLLREVDPDEAAHGTLEASHWAVGWYRHVVIDPSNEAVVKVMKESIEMLADYPILDECDFSDLECERHADNACSPDVCGVGPHCETCGDALEEDGMKFCERHTPEVDR